jgi:hypothetical protein
MCPMCIGTATLYLAGGTSAGGLALLVRRILKRLTFIPQRSYRWIQTRTIRR